MNPKAEDLARYALAALVPPPELLLSEWTEENIVLPPSANVRRTGRTKNWPFMVEILNAIGATDPERVTVMKSARLGFTKGLIFATAALAVMNPCPVGILVPTDEDAIRISVDDLEPIFEHSPKLIGVIRDRANNGRSTILRKQLLGGGSIRVLSARAPRKLRAHDFRALLVDEADAIEITKEGDAIAIAEKRTLAQSPRKIVIGGTPVEEGLSAIEARFDASTKEIYEVPCPSCGIFNEIQWKHLEWDNTLLTDADKAASVVYRCPHCNEGISEAHKTRMCELGEWRALQPHIKGHRGFRINALISLLPNAKWPNLVEEFLRAKRGGPSLMMPFVNTVLGLPFRTTTSRVDASSLAGRIEPWGLSTIGRETIIPKEVLLITAGVDVQPDRLELTMLGWGLDRNQAPLVLGRRIFDGNTLEPNGGCWKELDAFAKKKWRNERGWSIGIDAMAVDSGGKSGTTQIVYDWCFTRLSRRIYAIKGVAGKRKIWEKSKKVLGDMRLFNIATDIVKPEVMDALAREPFDEEGNADHLAFRYSDQLDDDWFEQATNEVRRIKYKGLRAEYVYEPKFKAAPVEALDCLVYGWAVRRAPGVLSIDLHDRAAREPEPETAEVKVEKPKTSGGGWAERFNQT